MDTLRIAICEDNETEYQELQAVLNQSGIACACTRFEEGASFLARFYPGQYDLILMDIIMEGLSGVETVTRLRESDNDVTVAFITTSQDYAMDGYRLRVSRYIRKPFQAEEVTETLRLALREKRNLPGVTLSLRDGARTIPFREIRYLEQSNHRLKVFLTGGRTLEFRERLDHLEPRFPNPPFFRCHKSYLVNLTQAHSLNLELSAFKMNEGGFAYIRRPSLSKASKALEGVLFNAARNL